MSTSRMETEHDHITWEELDKKRYYVLGPAMLLAVRAAVYPSNLVKTRLQVQSKSKPMYRGAFDAFSKIARTEGILGFYKGFGTSTANVASANLYISVYEMIRNFVVVKAQCGDTVANFLAGACASLVSQTVIVPLDIVSQRLMVHQQNFCPKGNLRQAITSQKSKIGMTTVMRDIYCAEGILGFYRGYLASIATYAPSSSIWWGSYGMVFPIYFNWMRDWGLDVSWKKGLSGGTSGILAAVLTNPMDIVRTRRQIYTQYSTIDTIRYIIKREGFRGFMTGAVARMLSMGPSGFLIISSYEYVKRLSRKSPEARS